MKDPVISRFASGLVIAKAKRYAARICDALGPKRIVWMIETEHSLSEFVSEAFIAAIFEVEVSDLPTLRRQWGWTSRAVSDKQFRDEVLPLFVQALIVEKGEKGERWCAQTVAWLRTQMGG